MITYSSSQKVAKRFPAGRFGSTIHAFSVSGKDDYGQPILMQILATRGNVEILESDDVTNLSRIVNITVYTRSIEELLVKQPERCTIILDNNPMSKLDVSDVTHAGVYSFIKCKQVFS